jgi:FkbM family methyltransferase
MENFKLTPFKYREIIPKISKNEKYIKNVDETKFLSGYPLNKFWTFDFIETISNYLDFDSIKTILDLGSRDGHQSVEFRTWFPEARIIAFEANPNQISYMREITKQHNIEIVDKAVGNYNGNTKFFISNANIGASSLLKTNDHFRSKEWHQYEINVEMIRVDDWCKKNNVNEIDILWIDVQGAEKIVIEGLGDYLLNVKAICTEVEIEHMYHDSVLKDELDSILENYGFINVATFHMCPEKNLTYEYLKKYQGEVDVIYVNKKFIKNELN